VFGGRKTWFTIGLALTLVGLGGLASAASATFHEMKIREVSPGTGVPDSSYVEIQAFSSGQNFLSNGAKVVRCNATCSSPTVFSPFSDVGNGADQMTVVFGDAGLPSGSKDFTVDLNLDSIMAGGAVCYLSEPGFSDCVSWGSFSANSTLMANYGTTAGTPAPALVSGMALRRSITAGLCPTALDPVDDTNDSATDFTQTTPGPRPNSAPITEMPCSIGNPTSPINPAGNVRKRKCKKKHKSASPTPPAYSAKKHKCKKKKRR
jgi:hypothetical protein